MNRPMNEKADQPIGHSLAEYIARHGASAAAVRAAEYFTKLSFEEQEKAYPDFLNFLMTELGQDTEQKTGL